MGLRSSLAAEADVRVFPAVCAGGRASAVGVPLLPGVRVVDSPRAANVLLIVGRVTRPLLRPLLALHDQLPRPRASVCWPTGGLPDELVSAVPNVVPAEPGDVEALRRVHRDLFLGERPSDPPALLDIEPARWRGVGPYGTGGTGMTGGVPYGRPLPGRGPDPDGLQLDELPLALGPFFPAFPAGLVLHVTVQGDVIRKAAVGPNPFTAWPGDPAPGPLDTSAFVRALFEPTAVAELEVGRARHHLRWLAHVLRLHGLGALGTRALALGDRLPTADVSNVERLVRRVRRSRSLRSATVGIGPLDTGTVTAGPAARAAGVAVDARMDDPAYEGLGFTPVVHHGGDAWARLVQRLDEIERSLDLAARAGPRVRAPGPPVETPRGPITAQGDSPSAALLDVVPDAIAGLEWADAMVTVASLDLDLEEAAMSTVPQTVP